MLNFAGFQVHSDDYVNAAAGEECEDGNADDTDWCTSVCELADCRDDILNADEMDTDCGGHCGRGSCVAEQSCTVHSDCATGWCSSGSCESAGKLAAGLDHTCALLATGAVRCWGSSQYGQLGYNNTIHIGNDEDPATAGDVDVGGTVVQLAAGAFHTCALLSTGAVRCWGRNLHGQLGYGHTNNIGDNEPPSSAGDVDVGGSVTQIAAGIAHTCALLDSGAVRCWGHGANGRLGYGNTDEIGNDESPASAGDVDVGDSVVQIAAGSTHTCALLASNAVRCWGEGQYGQLGYGNTAAIGDGETPASAGDVNVGGSAVQVVTGSRFTCALLDTGNVRCWGYANYGALGYGNTTSIGDNEPPSSAGDVAVGAPVLQLAAGSHHMCALLDSGAVRCWGYGRFGQLGYAGIDNVGDSESPSSAGDVDIGGTALQLVVGAYHACSLLSTGAVRCWGKGYQGQLGYGNQNDIGDDEHPSTAGDVNIGAAIL